MNIEDIMIQDGWVKIERENAGKIYVEFRKSGLVIDEDDIQEEARKR